MANLEEEIKKLGHEIQRKWDWDGRLAFNVFVKIPKWDIDELVLIWEEDGEYHIADTCNPGWDEHFEKNLWSLQEAIEDYFKPMEDE